MSTTSWLRRSALLLTVLCLCVWGLGRPVRADYPPVKGAWLSPDWLFPGPTRYSEADVRRIAAQTLDQVKRQGINTVFLETMLRGTTICPAVAVASDGTVSAATPELQARYYPVYQPLAFDFRVENGEPVDTLQIFIDEGRKRNIRVHAWCHAFYWRMDNTSSDLVPSWKEGHSAWDDMLAGYLRKERTQLSSHSGASSPLVTAVDQARQLVDAGYQGPALEKILETAGIPCDHNPLGSLIKAIMAAGGDAPGFVLIASPDDPFPAPKHKQLRAIFVDPANLAVQNRIIAMVQNIAQGHPGLAGVQLDHIRYPTGPVGTPPELGLLHLGVNDVDYFDPNNPILNERFEKTVELLAQRRETIKNFVNRVRQHIGGRLQLSACILPEYQLERNNGRYRISYWEFISQDWYHWQVDFVVPLMYEVPAWKIRTEIIRFRQDLEALYGDEVPIQMYPGVSRLQQAQSGLLNQEDWVFFDLKLADDVRVVKEQQVDPLGGEQPAGSASVSPSPSPAASVTPPSGEAQGAEVHPSNLQLRTPEPGNTQDVPPPTYVVSPP